MKLFLAFLCLSSTVLAELTPRSLSDCIDAVNAAFGYPSSVLKSSPALSLHADSSLSSYKSTAGISGYSHSGGPLQVTKYVAPVKGASYESAVTYAKGGSITYADKSPASKFAAVVPSGIEFKNLVTPVIGAKKVTNAYLPPITSHIETYQSPGFSTVGTYTSGGYSKADSLESIFSSGAASPLVSSISYAPKVSYGAPTVTKLSTLSSHGTLASAEPLALAPTAAVYAPSISKTYLPGVETSGYSKSAVATQYVSAPVKVATYAAPAASHYISTPAKVATYSSAASHLAQGGISHQYVSKPIAQIGGYVTPVLAKSQAAYVAPAVAKVATYSAPSVGYSSSGAVSHQYVSKPAVQITGYPTPAVTKVATYSAPVVAKIAPISTHVTSVGGALSHQYVSKPVAHVTAYAAPSVAKVATYTGDSSLHYSSGGGSTSHQYISKPAPQIVAYAAPAVAKVATYQAPAVSKIATYSGESSGLISSSSGAGALSHQYVSKPAPQVVAYAAPAVAKVATYQTPAVSKIATYSGESLAHFSSSGGSGALSHQYVSKPAPQVVAYAAPAVGKVATYQAPAVSKIATYSAESSGLISSSSGAGALSHQYVSKPAPQVVAYAAPAVAKVATYQTPAVSKIATYSGDSLAHFSSSGGSGALSHQYVSKPAPQVVAYAAPAVAKVATYQAPAVSKLATYSGESLAHFSSSGGAGALSHQYVSKPAPQIVAYAAPAVAKVATYQAPAVSKLATYSGESLAHFSSSGGAGAISHQYVSKPTGLVSGYAAPAVAKVATFAAPAAAVSVAAAPLLTKSVSYSGESSSHLGGAISHQYVSKPTGHVSGYAAPALGKIATYSTPIVAAPAVAKVASYVAPAAVKVAGYSGESSAHFSTSGGGAISHQYVSKPTAHISGYHAPAIAKVSTYTAPVVNTPAIAKIATYPAATVVASYSGESSAHLSASGGGHGAISHQYVSKPVHSLGIAVPAIATPALVKYGSSAESSSQYTSGLGGAVSHQYVAKPSPQSIAYAAPAIAKVVPLAAPASVKLSSYSSGGSSLQYSGSGGALSHQYVSKPTAHITGYAGPAATKYITSGEAGILSQQLVTKPAVQLTGYAAPVVPKIATYSTPAVSTYSGASHISTGGAVSHQYVSKPALAIGKVATYSAPAYAQYASGPAAHPYSSLHSQNLNPLLTSSSITRYGSSGASSKQYLAQPVQLGKIEVGGGYGESTYAGHGAISHQHVSKPLAATTLVSSPALAKVAYGSKLASAADFGSHQYISQPLQTVHLSAPANVVGGYAKLDASALHTSSIHGGASSIHGATSSIHGSHGGALSHQYVSKPLQGIALAKPATLTSPIVVAGSGHLTTGSGKYSSLSSGYLTSGAHGSVSQQYVSQPLLSKGGVLAAGHLGSKLLATPALQLSGGHAGYYSTGSGALAHQQLSKQGVRLTNIHGSALGSGLHSIAGGNYYGAISLGHTGTSPAIGGVHDLLGLTSHGLSSQLGSIHGIKGISSAHGSLAHGSLGHLGPLAGYNQGIGGIGPLGAGFYRYAPAVPALSSHTLSPAAYLKSAPIIQPAKIKVMTETHLEHFNDHARYAFEYGVNDPTTGDIKHQREERDGDVVRGEYSLVEPDGNVRTVKYYADWETGFHAQVINSRDSVKTLTKRTASKS